MPLLMVQPSLAMQLPIRLASYRKKDPMVVVLVNVPNHLAITIARVAEIHICSEQPARQTAAIAWSSMSKDVPLKLQVHAVRAIEAISAHSATRRVSAAGNCNLVTVPQMWWWCSGLISVSGDLVSAVNPEQATNDTKLAWPISASTLRALGDVIWERHHWRSAEFPKISLLTSLLLYKDLQNNPVFCQAASAQGEASGIGDPNKRQCPKCKKHVKSQEMRAHVATHILQRAVDPRVCGYCGNYGRGCTVGLKHSSGFGLSKVFKPCGDCKVDRHPYQDFSMAHASKDETAVCSQRPMKCPLCEGEVYVWKYAMHAHVYEHHFWASALQRLVEDPTYVSHDNEWRKLSATQNKRMFLLPAEGFSMDGTTSSAIATSASSTTATSAATAASAEGGAANTAQMLGASQLAALSQIAEQTCQFSQLHAVRTAAAAAASAAAAAGTTATAATTTAVATAMTTTTTMTATTTTDSASGSGHLGSRQSDLPPRSARAGAAAALAAVRSEGALPPPPSP